MNPLERYREAGAAQAKAQRQRDQGRVDHWSRWVRAAIRLESGEYKAAAERAYLEGYRGESGRA